MSQHLIGRYLNELSDLRRASGRGNESIVREAFKTLLKDWGRSKDLIFVPEYPYETVRREQRFIDGALVPSQLRVPLRLLGSQGRRRRPRPGDRAQVPPRLSAGQHRLRGFTPTACRRG